MNKSFPASTRHLYDMLSFIKENANNHPKIFHIELVSEEVLVNIITHGSTDQIHIEICCKLDLFEITFKDGSFPFDPTVFSSLKGRGLSLVQQIASNLSYRRDNEENILTISFT